MPRFFVPPADFGADTVTLRGDNARHIAYALRMAAGDTVTLCDGAGRAAVYRLARFAGDTVTAERLPDAVPDGELPLAVTLYMGMPKGDKLELVVQKAVELGAAAIVPFVGERSVVRPRAERAERQTERLSRIAQEAAGQCGRAVLPRVGAPLPFAAALADAKSRGAQLLLCYEDEHALSLRRALEALRAAWAADGQAEGDAAFAGQTENITGARTEGDNTTTKAPAGNEMPEAGARPGTDGQSAPETATRPNDSARPSIALFVGAEGGISPAEVTAFRAAGGQTVTLGPRILRCETAPLAALACVGFVFED